METIEYRTIDRSGWPRGEWDDEPDKVQWPDSVTGLPCVAKRHPRSGHWCGYVGVAPGHPMHGKGYGTPNVDVHGGLTYADACEADADEATGICHIPGAGEPGHVWWFGFDCHHYCDVGPAQLTDDYISRFGRDWDASYKTLQYVKNERTSLAKQLKDAS